MICISKQWLDLVAPDVTLDSRPGLFVSPIFSFGGGGNCGKDTAAFKAEEMPRALVLVGMADRYGVGARQSSNILTLCVDSTGLGARLPSPPELRTLITQLSELAERTVPIVALRKKTQVRAQVIDLLSLLEEKLLTLDPPSPEDEAMAAAEYKQWGELESRLKEQEPVTSVIEQLAPPPRGDTAARDATVIEQLAPPPRGDTAARATKRITRSPHRTLGNSAPPTADLSTNATPLPPLQDARHRFEQEIARARGARPDAVSRPEGVLPRVLPACLLPERVFLVERTRSGDSRPQSYLERGEACWCHRCGSGPAPEVAWTVHDHVLHPCDIESRDVSSSEIGEF